MGDVVLVLGTGGAGGDATASGCCWSQGEHGRVRAGRLVATGGALGVLQHHTQSNSGVSQSRLIGNLKKERGIG